MSGSEVWDLHLSTDIPIVKLHIALSYAIHKQRFARQLHYLQWYLDVYEVTLCVLRMLVVYEKYLLSLFLFWAVLHFQRFFWVAMSFTLGDPFQQVLVFSITKITHFAIFLWLLSRFDIKLFSLTKTVNVDETGHSVSPQAFVFYSRRCGLLLHPNDLVKRSKHQNLFII